MMQASYSVMLLVHSNYNLTEIEYCFFFGKIIIAPALFRDAFITPSKYGPLVVHFTITIDC